MVLALRQWYPLASAWTGIWTGWPWGVAGNRVCLEKEAEVSRPVVGTGSAQPGWGGVGSWDLATSFPAIKFKCSRSTSQNSLAYFLLSFEVEVVWVQKHPGHSGSLPAPDPQPPAQGLLAFTLRGISLRLPAPRGSQLI